MIVRRAAVLGRCMGVKRAVDLALSAAARERPATVFTLALFSLSIRRRIASSP